MRLISSAKENTNGVRKKFGTVDAIDQSVEFCIESRVGGYRLLNHKAPVRHHDARQSAF